MSRFIRTKDGIIYDLQSKEVSSWEYIDNDTAINEYGVEGAFYTIYYFDENEGHYSEYDGKGGHSCDFIEEKDIIKQADAIPELCDLFYLDRGRDIDINEFYDKHQFDVAKENYLEEIRHSNPIELKAYINTDKGLICVAKAKTNEGGLELI